MSMNEHAGVSGFDTMRNRILLTSVANNMVKEAIGPVEKYKLTVTGVVTYSPDDFELRDLLLNEGDMRARLPEALQELEEEAADVKITLEKIS